MSNEELLEQLYWAYEDMRNLINREDFYRWSQSKEDEAVETFEKIKENVLSKMQTEEKEPIHVHEEYPEHDWYKEEDGKVDEWAAEYGYHNGPRCKRCFYDFCIHCDPDGWNKEPCVVDYNLCPKCKRRVSRHEKYCTSCGQALKWDIGDKEDDTGN